MNFRELALDILYPQWRNNSINALNDNGELINVNWPVPPGEK